MSQIPKPTQHKYGTRRMVIGTVMAASMIVTSLECQSLYKNMVASCIWQTCLRCDMGPWPCTCKWEPRRLEEVREIEEANNIRLYIHVSHRKMQWQYNYSSLLLNVIVRDLQHYVSHWKMQWQINDSTVCYYMQLLVIYNILKHGQKASQT